MNPCFQGQIYDDPSASSTIRRRLLTLWETLLEDLDPVSAEHLVARVIMNLGVTLGVAAIY
jgi:hypothetical protein